MNNAKFSGKCFAVCFLVAVILQGCNGCKKRVVEPVSPIKTIEATYNPLIDSIKTVNNVLRQENKMLKEELANQKKKTAAAESNAQVTSKRLREALAKKDTGKIITYAEDVANDNDAYRTEVKKQDSIYENSIRKLEENVETLRGEIQLHESKTALVKQAYEVKEVEANQWKSEAQTLLKKLKHSKFWNKVLGIGGPILAIVAAALLL